MFDQTEQQTSADEQRTLALSLKRSQPPVPVPGYEPQRFLGAGAYGEVWVATDRNTGRQVAIKFYAHRGGLDWSLLSREVEKLVFLSADRYVVQLLDVGWDSEPPYYVMEYVERGSLEDRLHREGPLNVSDAVALFRDVATGLLHAHAKGVLHCDLKPANVLLDLDSKPRLADFGQSRLSHEQTPALGTLFFMAPEQADLNAVPDVRWDVYALGALLYAMLTGVPPHRSVQSLSDVETATGLEERLYRYRRLLETSPPPHKHRYVKGVDRALADIVDRSLAVNRHDRYPNVQAVLDALDAREQRRARRPLMLLGAVGPALVLVVVSLIAWRWFDSVVSQSDEALRGRALESNRFAAEYVAKAVTNELEKHYRAVEEMATSRRFQSLLEITMDDPSLADLIEQLDDAKLVKEKRRDLLDKFRSHPARQALQERMMDLLKDETVPDDIVTWFVNGPHGLQLACAPDGPTLGLNFGWRNYFHGQSMDEPEDWRPGPDDHITETNLSNVFLSKSSKSWSVAITTPIMKEGTDGKFLGVIGVVVEVGQFVQLQSGDKQFAVLVDLRRGKDHGLVLQHPLFDELIDKYDRLPDRMHSYRLSAETLPEKKELRENYSDPLGRDPEGSEYDRHWLAEIARVSIRDGQTGWVVIVQESYDGAIGRTLSRLKESFRSSGVLAVTLIAVLSTGLWGFVIRVLGQQQSRSISPPRRESTS